MSVLRQALSTISGYVGSNSMDVPDALRPAAQVYAAACREVNDRLAESDRLLALSQRSEALRLVHLEPDALDQYRELAFRGADRWAEVTQAAGLDDAPRLDAEAADRLTAAVAAEKAVADTLRQHRTLALARAPLRQRLAVLRRLTAAEPANHGWREDQRLYELGRLEEMRKDLADPVRRADWAVVRELHDDLQADGWVAPKPAELVDAVRKRAAALRRQEGARLMAALGPKLDAARAAAEAAAASGAPTARPAAELDRLVAEGRAVAIDYKLAVTDPGVESVRLADEWLAARAEDAEYQAQVGQLRDALADGLDWYYVQEHYRVVMGYGRPIPLDVADAFADKVRTRRLIFWAGVAGGVGVGLVAAAVGLYLAFA